MNDWNVVASVQPEGYGGARRVLGALGAVGKTDYFNVLTVRVEDVEAFLEALRERIELEPGTLNLLGRAVPARVAFDFRSPEEFEEKAREACVGWLPRLAGLGFHVRMHRRGFKGKMSSQAEEQRLAEALLGALERAGTPGRVAFGDPDAILSVETVGGRAGLSLWTREELGRYPFLGLD